MIAWIGLLGMLQVGLADAQQDARAAIQTDAGWVDVGSGDRDGIGPIRVRHLELSGVDCLEASTSTDLPVDIMRAVVLDIRGNTEWSSADLRSSVVLANAGGQIDYVQVAGVPTPFADRYWFLRGQVAEAGQRWTFAWERIDGQALYPQQHAQTLAANKGAVEVDVNVGSWSFAPVDAGQTEVRFRSCTNIGGSVPRWVGERAARMMLPNNIVDLIKETRRRMS